MDAFKAYCLKHATNALDFLVSGPPEPVFLLWKSKVDGDLRNNPQMAAMILIKEGDAYARQKPLMTSLYETLKAAKANVVVVKYPLKFDTLTIDKEQHHNLDDAAQALSKALNMPLRNTKTKAVNDRHEVTDPFHLWSSHIFDGCCVVKTDLDMVAFKNGKPKAVIEIKRSTKVNLHTWQPYDNDITGYLSQIHWAANHDLYFYTVMHDCYPEKNGKTMQDQTSINTFALAPKNARRGRAISDLILSKKPMEAAAFLQSLNAL